MLKIQAVVPHKGSISQIFRNVYVGDEAIANDYRYLRHIKIKRIIVAGQELKQVFPQDFKYLYLPIKDSKTYPIKNHFEEVNQFLAEAQKRKEAVLIHCALGRSRSCTLIAAYLMYRHSIDSFEALNYVRQKRQNASPNEGFITQLQQYIPK